MLNKPLLSICIPTWNRGYCLVQVIDNIVNQSDFHSWKVELVISDNASTDNTETLVKSYQLKYKNIIYERNNENIWAMPNISKVLSMWNWEYIRWIWSDDLILDWWIKATLDLIKQYTPYIIVHSTTDNKIIYHPFIRPDKDIYLESSHTLLFNSQKDYLNYLWDRYIHDKSWFINGPWLNLSYLSILYMKKSEYEKSKKIIIKDRWQIFFNYFSFLHTLTAHYKEREQKEWIILLLKPFVKGGIITDNKLAEKSWWSPNFYVANHVRYLNNYLFKKYKLGKNFNKFRNKSNIMRLIWAIANWWFLSFLYRYLKKLWTIPKIKEIISKLF
jgi:glycosyltransferase involved in cell wall biosynthesis